MQRVMTRTVEMLLQSEDILFVKVLPGAEFTLENTVRDRKASLKLTGNRKVKVLIDGNADFTSTAEGLAYAASVEANANRKAVAFVSESLASSLIANFFSRINKPGIPYSIFKTKEEALVWLRSFE